MGRPTRATTAQKRTGPKNLQSPGLGPGRGGRPEPSIIALAREPSAALARCELTHLERAPIDAALAARQHAAYLERLRGCGAEVLLLPADADFPDGVFVEDAAVVLDEVAIITRPAPPSRRGEIEAIEKALGPFRPITRLAPPATLEGGDVLPIGRTLYVGASARTNRAGVDQLRKLARPHGYRVIGVPVRGCLHLKTGCTAIDAETILVNRGWVDLAPFRGLRVVDLPTEEPRAANTLPIGGRLLMHAGFARTIDLVGRLGARVETVDLSEFLKAEGGPTCLSLLFGRFFRPRCLTAPAS
jgi:dimethylargininase